MKIYKIRLLMFPLRPVSGHYHFKEIDFYCKAKDECEAINKALHHAEHEHDSSVVKVKRLHTVSKGDSISVLNELEQKVNALTEKVEELGSMKEKLEKKLEKAKAVPADPRIKLIKDYEEDKGSFSWNTDSDDRESLNVPFTAWDACIHLEREGIGDISESLMKECNPELFPIKELGLYTMRIPLSDTYSIETRVWIVPVLDIRKEE